MEANIQIVPQCLISEGEGSLTMRPSPVSISPLAVILASSPIPRTLSARTDIIYDIASSILSTRIVVFLVQSDSVLLALLSHTGVNQMQ